MKMQPTTRFELPDGFTFGQALDSEGMIPSRRQDGWTAARQRDFLCAIAEGATVEKAAAGVGLSWQSAYSLRQRAAGAVFALGWAAALLLQRQKLADELTRRAFDGQTDTLTRADGSEVTRHRHDNRLALALLTRLDRHAEATTPELEAARLAAGEWQRYLDLVAADASPAQAGLFLAARAPTAADGKAGMADALAPVLSLARADLYVRTRCGTVAEIDASDLDPAQRGEWTAEQWTRAEAAGLLTLGDAHKPQHPQRSPAAVAAEEEEEQEREPVWFDHARNDWRTSFPPAPGTSCDEEGEPGAPGYSRSLTADEEDIADAPRRQAQAEHQAREEDARDAWFIARADAEQRASYDEGLRAAAQREWDDEHEDEDEEDEDEDEDEGEGDEDEEQGDLGWDADGDRDADPATLSPAPDPLSPPHAGTPARACPLEPPAPD
jgi:hypothetical protein